MNNPAGGNFTSPGYLVSNYSNNLNCEWLIQNPQHVNSSIVVLIEELHLENQQTCESDYLQLRLGECCYTSADRSEHLSRTVQGEGTSFTCFIMRARAADSVGPARTF